MVIFQPFFLLVLFIFFEKSNDLYLTEEKNIDKDAIYIRFIDEPIFNGQLKTPNGPSIGQSCYIVIYDDLEREEFSLEDLKLNNSVKYVPSDNQVILRRYLSFFEFQDFIVSRGDSLIMSYDRNKPIHIQNTSREYFPQDFNFEIILNEREPESYKVAGQSLDTFMYSFVDFYKNPKEVTEHKKRTDFEKRKHIELLNIKANKHLTLSMAILQKKAFHLLDSLSEQKEISQNIYTFYKNKYSSILLKTEIMSAQIDSINASKIMNTIFERNENIDIYSLECLKAIGEIAYSSKSRWINMGEYHIRDVRESLDLAMVSKLLKGNAKNQLLFLYLSLVDSHFPDETAKYLNLFSENVSDSLLNKKAEYKYQRASIAINSSSTLHLVTPNESNINIENIIKANSGKILYLDFWASWCQPCIAEMKHSLALREANLDKGLEVIFISTDDSQQKWDKASKRLFLSTLENSFRVLDAKNSDFIKNHKIVSIPRYMIIDKTGKIVNANAPRPSDLKIHEVLDKLLK